MERYKVKISSRAMRELDSIYEYIVIEKLDPENAKRQVDRIKKAILSLDTFPKSHQERNGYTSAQGNSTDIGADNGTGRCFRELDRRIGI